MYTTSTLRRRGQALPSRESLPHMHNVAPDSVAMARHPTPHGGRPPKAARHHAPSRLWQPPWPCGLGVGLWWLPLAHEVRKVLPQVDRLGHFSLLGAQQGELLGLRCRALRLPPEHQPGGPARRERWGRGLCHDGERLAPALASGCQTLGLADTADIGGDAAIAPGIAPRVELPKQLHRGPAAGVPALE